MHRSGVQSAALPQAATGRGGVCEVHGGVLRPKGAILFPVRSTSQFFFPQEELSTAGIDRVKRQRGAMKAIPEEAMVGASAPKEGGSAVARLVR